MLGLFRNRFRPTDTTLGIYQLGWVEQGLAIVALVSPCPRGTAMRAGALYEAVGKETVTIWAIELFQLMFADIPRIVDFLEYLLDDFGLLFGTGTSEIIEGNIEPRVDITVNCMVTVAKLPGGNPFFQGSRLSSGTIFVGTADIKRFISLGTAKPGKYVGGKNLGQVTKVRNIVYIRQCRSN
jgi:hypothetical protein